MDADDSGSVFDWLGQERERVGGSMNYTLTGREWVCVDKATDEWEFK